MGEGAAFSLGPPPAALPAGLRGSAPRGPLPRPLPLAPGLLGAAEPAPRQQRGLGVATGEGEEGKGGGEGGGVRRQRGLLVPYKITKNKWKQLRGSRVNKVNETKLAAISDGARVRSLPAAQRVVWSLGGSEQPTKASGPQAQGGRGALPALGGSRPCPGHPGGALVPPGRQVLVGGGAAGLPRAAPEALQTFR